MVKCSEVSQCSDGLSKKGSNTIRRHIDNMKLLLVFCYYHWHSSATLTEGFPCFFLSCKANARVNPAKMGHGPYSSNFCVVPCIVCFVSFCVLFVCKCVVYYCHRVATLLQLTNTSYQRWSHVDHVQHVLHSSRKQMWLKYNLKQMPTKTFKT